jgi:hypothetical protein
MATSGQTMAHIAHPVHSPLSLNSALWYPAALSLSDWTMTFFGQKFMHSPHSLQSSRDMTIFPLSALTAGCLSGTIIL